MVMEIRRTVFGGSVDDWIVLGKDIFRTMIFFSFFFSFNSEINARIMKFRINSSFRFFFFNH